MSFSDMSTIVDLGGQNLYCNSLRVGVSKPDLVGPFNATTIGSSVSANVMSTLAFGTIGDGVADDTAALNSAFSFGAINNVGIYIPAGKYKITSPLFVTQQGSNQQSCHIVGAGRGFSKNQTQTIIDATAITNKPAIIIQRGFGCYLGHFMVLGGNIAPQTFIANYGPMLYNAAWVTGSLRDSRYSPHCGIYIDGGVGSTPPDGGYPGLTYQGATTGSSDVVLDNIGLWNFVVGIMHNSEQNVANGDNVRIINPQIVYAKVGIASGQSQSDACTVFGGNIGFCRTCVDMLEYGQQQGHPMTLIEVQYGPGFECFSQGGSFGPQNLFGGRAESVHRLGQIGTGSSPSSFPLLLDGFDCHVLNQTLYPQTRCPIVLESASSPVEWNGGGLSEDSTNGASSFALVGQPLTMRGAFIRMANRFQPFIGGSLDFQYPVELRNCRVADNTNAVIYGNESRQFSLSSRVSAHWSEGKLRDANNLYQYKPGAGDNYINIGAQSAIVFTSTTLTFNNNDPSGLQIGDLIMWRFNAVGKSLVQHTVPAVQITGIVGSVVTCNLLYPLSYYDQTSNIGTTSVVVNEWASAPTAALTANTTNTSPTLSSVSPTTVLQNGDWISGAGIPANTRVVSGGGTATVTMSRNATATATGINVVFGTVKTVQLV